MSFGIIDLSILIAPVYTLPCQIMYTLCFSLNVILFRSTLRAPVPFWDSHNNCLHRSMSIVNKKHVHSGLDLFVRSLHYYRKQMFSSVSTYKACHLLPCYVYWPHTSCVLPTQYVQMFIPNTSLLRVYMKIKISRSFKMTRSTLFRRVKKKLQGNQNERKLIWIDLKKRGHSISEKIMSDYPTFTAIHRR